MEFYEQNQMVLVLVGLIGTGKSDFANSLQMTYPNIVRCNQDDLGNRPRVEARLHSILQNGQSACIDRVNFDQAQRETWIGIARQYPGVKVCALHLDVPRGVCLRRLRTRENHPTIKNYEQAVTVMQFFSSRFRPPCSCEGFDAVVRYKPSEEPRTQLPVVTTDGSEAQAAPTGSALPFYFPRDEMDSILSYIAQLASGEDRRPTASFVNAVPCNHRRNGPRDSYKGPRGGRGRGGKGNQSRRDMDKNWRSSNTLPRDP